PRPRIESLRLGDVQCGPVKIEAVTISRLEIEGGSNQSLEIHHCQIDSFTAPRGSFPTGASFFRTPFVRLLALVEWHTPDSLDLTYSRVSDVTSLRRTSVGVRANFDYSEFVGETDCERFQVAGRVSLRGLKVGGAWHIREATIDSRPPDI